MISAHFKKTEFVLNLHEQKKYFVNLFFHKSALKPLLLIWIMRQTSYKMDNEPVITY